MKKYLYDYIKEIDNLLDSRKIQEEDIQNHLIKIGFFQHERLIHLYVTLFCIFLFFVFSGLGFIFSIFFLIAFMLLLFSICYLVHYFHLENGVQYLYKQYDKMIDLRK